MTMISITLDRENHPVMEPVLRTVREDIIETINKLFIYTDAQNWQGLMDEVFMEKVWFDMSSLGGEEPKELDASAICNAWKQGFTGIDSIHHQAGNHVVTLQDDYAVVFCYAIALHYKESATKGKTREYVGSYQLEVKKTGHGWRLNSFRYQVKFIKGNIELH